MSDKITYVPITSIKPCGKAPVYNMEVEKYHNFSVNGGIIVHNCADAIRYFVQTTGVWQKKDSRTLF